jgi:fatty-acyl-CoA synthase
MNSVSSTQGLAAVDRAPDYLRFHAQARPGKLALADLTDHRRWSYSELSSEADRFATALKSRWHVGLGDRVAVLARNSGTQLLVHLACSRLGAMFVPLNWRLAPSELVAILLDAEPRLLGYDEESENLVRALDSSTCGVPLTTIESAARVVEPMPVPAVPLEAPTLILYTSGTTGTPKGVVLSEKNVLFSALNFSAVGEVEPSSVGLCDTPMFHVISLCATIHALLLQGGTVLLSSGFREDTTLERLTDPGLRVSHYFCVPQMAVRLREHPSFDARKLQGLTALFTGGAPNPAAHIRQWHADGIRMVNGYGMTETGTLLGMPIDAELILAKAGSVGVAAPSTEIRLVRLDGEEAAVDETGEIWVRGPHVMPGYWRRATDTARVFGPEGWFRSGDLGRRDDDGFYFIVGRIKDMFISGGENIYPAEVEACLAEHLAVSEVAVIGSADERWGEVGVAFVVRRAGAQVDERSLIEHCEARIARYKVPRRFVFLECLPRTATGKVQKETLRLAAARKPESP